MSEDRQDFLRKQRAYLMWLLARRDYSRFQLEQKLRKRETTPAEIQALLASLVEQGFFREDNFKRVRVRGLVRRGYGPRYIQSKLATDKIRATPEDFAQAYEEINSNAFEKIDALIEKLVEKWKFKNLTIRELQAKVLNNLMAKGHSVGVILERFRAHQEKT